MCDRSSQLLRIVFFYIVFAVLFLSGMVLTWPSLISSMTDSESATKESSLEAPGIENVETVPQFERMVSSSRGIVFLDGDFTYWAVAYRPMLDEFARRHGDDFQVFRLDLTEYNTPLWRAAQEWQKSNSIPPGGYKTLGGVGRVIWIAEGAVTDYAWGYQIESVEAMIERSHTAIGDE